MEVFFLNSKSFYDQQYPIGKKKIFVAKLMKYPYTRLYKTIYYLYNYSQCQSMFLYL